MKWARKVCAKTYSTPVVAGGKVFLCGGGDDRQGVVACLEEKTGEILWHGKAATGRRGSGSVPRPWSSGDRLYVVNPNCVATCLDVNGQADGPDRRKPPVLWTLDMHQRLKTYPADIFCGSGVIDGDVLYLPTSNGIDPFGPGPPSGCSRWTSSSSAAAKFAPMKRLSRAVARRPQPGRIRQVDRAARGHR